MEWMLLAPPERDQSHMTFGWFDGMTPPWVVHRDALKEPANIV